MQVATERQTQFMAAIRVNWQDSKSQAIAAYTAALDCLDKYEPPEAGALDSGCLSCRSIAYMGTQQHRQQARRLCWGRARSNCLEGAEQIAGCLHCPQFPRPFALGGPSGKSFFGLSEAGGHNVRLGSDAPASWWLLWLGSGDNLNCLAGTSRQFVGKRLNH